MMDNKVKPPQRQLKILDDGTMDYVFTYDCTFALGTRSVNFHP